MAASKKAREAKARDTHAVMRRLDALCAQRATWEEGAYKASNDELYAILSGCFELLCDLRGDSRLRKGFDNALQEQGHKLQSNTSLPLKIVRVVFGDCGHRAYGYARVLTVAYVEKPKEQSLSDFIIHRGGVEEIRRTPKSGVNPTQKREGHIDNAAEILAGREAITGRVMLSDGLQPNPDANHDFVIALIRWDGDNRGSIVYGTSNEALIKAVLAHAGKHLGQQEAAAAEEVRVREHQRRRDAATTKGAGEANNLAA